MPELCGDDEERKIAGVCIPSGKCINADAAAAERVNLGIAQFTRAIRKTALSALSAASQLFLLIPWRSLRAFIETDFHASMKSASTNARVNFCPTSDRSNSS